MGTEDQTQETSTNGSAGVNLNDPLVQAAIQKAVQDAERRFGKKLDEEVDGLKKNRDALKGEKEKLQKELDSIRTRAEAAEHGVDATKLEELAELKAKTKAEMIRREVAEEMEQLRATNRKLEERATASDRKTHRARVEALMAREEGIVPGAFNILADSVERIVTFQTVDGVDVPILQHNGETIQGTVSDLLKLAREGKGAIPDRTFCFASNGKGSGTTSTHGSVGSSTKNVHKMSREERIAFQREHGAAEFKRLVDTTPLPEVVLPQR